MDLHARGIINSAENVAIGLKQLRDTLPEYSAEITSVVADLYAISATLTSLDGLARQFPRNYGQIKPDLDPALASLRYTLNGIINSLGKLDRTSLADNYRRIWHDLDAYFHEEDGYSLARRLTKYKLFLQELQDVMQNKTVNISFMAGLRRSILKLLEEQDSRFAAHMAGLSLSPPGSSGGSSANSGIPREGHGIGTRRSYERARPGFRPHISPLQSPVSSHEGVPPWVPDVPVSPISTSTTTQSYISSATLFDHWASDVLACNGPAIGFPVVGESSECFGDEVQQDIKDWLHGEGFDEVLYLPFNEKESRLSVYFYVRKFDNRARILCKTRRNRSSSKYHCLPLNLLELKRIGPCLQLCRRRRSGRELVSWLNLQFRTMEKLAIFFCTFVALRSQDNHRQVQDIRDYELEAEKEMFGGLILDNGDDVHALRIYRDRLSGAIRLQASVYEGDMKRVPVWTAFIDRYIESPHWMRRINNQVILRELRRAVFFPDYTAPRTPRGEHILEFTSDEDAKDFIEVIEQLSLIDE